MMRMTILLPYTLLEDFLCSSLFATVFISVLTFEGSERHMRFEIIESIYNIMKVFVISFSFCNVVSIQL